MSSKTFDTRDLRLYGEHINLNSRGDEESRRNASLGCGRPRSALYTSNLNVPDSKRRPFSAGNHPSSLSIQPFLKKSQSERRDLLTKSSDFLNRSLSIPGAVDSTILFNKLVRDPILNSKQLHKQKSTRNIQIDFPSRHLFGCDNMSDVSSVDTVTSFGTKIKNKAQINKKLIDDNKPIEKIVGSPLKLIKSRPQRFLEAERTTDYGSDNKNELKDVAEPKNMLKLSIYVPNNNKDDNTSSGVSSSSDIQTFAASSPVAGHSGVQKFARTKRTISINWFPETTHRGASNEDEDQKMMDHTDLKGIVSFGDGNFSNKLENFDDEDDDCPPESSRLYNTELSLVEEESSQESDMSPKICSSIFERYTTSYERQNNDESNDHYLLEGSMKHETFDNENSRFNKLNNETEFEGRNSLLLNLRNSKNTILRDRFADAEDRSLNEFDESKTTTIDKETEMERRFKELENKYRVDVTHKNDVQIESLEINYGFDVNEGLKRAWTSLENVVSKENDPVCLINDKYDQYKYFRNDSGNSNVSEMKSNFQSYEGSHKNKDATNPNESYKLKTGNQEINKTPESTSEPLVHRYLKDIPDIIIDYSNGKTQIDSLGNSQNSQECDSINGRLIKEKDLSIKHTKDAPNENEIDKSGLQDNVEDLRGDDIAEYPEYLETNEARQYTSKVIEDYKREIATIDNAHELTLKDIRSGHNERFDIKNYGKLALPNTETTYDTIEPATSHFKQSSGPRLEPPDTLNKDISNFINEYKNYKLGDYKTSLDIKINKACSDFEETDKTQYITSSNIKAKKKIKKKERGSTAKYRNHSGNESGDSSLRRRTKTDTKRLAKSAPCKKDGNNRVRFKSQKIVLSKCTPNINRKIYDKENEIMSWMSTKISTSDETSSNDIHDTPTPDLIKKKSLEYSSEIHTHSKDIANESPEQRIEPIIKENSQEINDFMSETNRGTDNKINKTPTKENVTKDKSKMKEVSFEVNKYTPSISDDFSLNDWVGNESDGNELNELLDDDNIVSNIYSVLKEIEQTGTSMTDGGGDKLELKLSVDDGKSAEYRDILSYLEKVENTANNEISSLSHTQPPFSLKVEELMELSKGELAHRAVAGALAAGKAGAAAARLRAALVNAANRATARIKAERLAARQRANAAAQQSGQTIARHQKFIEQLINEKKALAERIEKLVAAVEAAESRSSRATRASAERLQLELKNQRQRLSQAHQREKQTWLKQHTQKIKDMTIKGLESEIRELEDKHAAQMLSVQREWEEKLSDEREKHSREIRLLKESTTRHLEDELDRERLLAAERMEQKRVEWESALAAASERAGAEGREAARGARKEAEQWKKDKEKELEDRRRQLEDQAEEKRVAIMSEAAHMKDKFTKEFEKYKEDYKKKQADVMRDREMEIRAITRRERDREIERAIESMEAEAEEGRKEMQETIRRIKAKYENDMKSLEEAEQSALQRCKEARELLRESQELCAQNQITITQLEGRLRQADELRAQTIAEMEISMRTAEMKSREEVEEMKAQLLNLQLQHKDEMHQLYAKVKVAVSKKDDALSAARRDAATLRDRCLRLEARLAI